jgi:parallel beta-helix repeat protein
VPDCSAWTAIAITADRVRVEHVAVFGGAFYSIDVEGRDRVTLKALETHDTCGSAEYGVNVFASTRVKVDGTLATDGYGDAGFYIGGIPDGGRVLVKRCTADGNSRGIIVEDSLPGSVAVQRNTVTGSQTNGIFLHNSDGIRVVGNTVQGTQGIGIELDATSDGNRILQNEIAGSGTADVADQGSGNCWKGNTFTTGSVPPCP